MSVPPPDPSPADAPPDRRGQAASRVLLAALVVGPLTGWLHGLELLVERHLLGHFAWYSREFAWMAPLAYTFCLLLGAIPLAVAALAWPGRVRPAVAWGWVVFLGAFGLLLPYPQLGRAASLVLAAGVGVQVGRLVGASRVGRGGLGVRLALVEFTVIGLLAAGLPVASRAAERREIGALPPAAPGVPNVLLVILDTVRASSLSLYGFAFPTTPFLERWSHEGTTFDWAIAPAPWTLPSHASFFTGRYPTELSANWTVPLDERTPVLAEAFRARGYLTAAVVGNHDYTAWDSGLQRGFIHHEDYLTSWAQLLRSTSYTQTAMGRQLLGARSLGDAVAAARSLDLSIDPKHAGDPRRADRITHAFLDWQAAHPDRPFFAFLNYFDAHQGYYSPPGFPQVPTPVAKGYHTAIAWIDANLDTLFTTLAQRGVLDHTVVVVASDHGELFNEHGLFGHANNLYRNVLHVPLVIRFPGAVPAGVRVRREVSLRDIAATVADLGGLEPGAFPGTSLRQAWRSDSGTLSPVLASVRQAPNVDPKFPTARGDMAAVFDSTRHYIRNFGGGEELFSYREDPLEVADLLKAEGPTVERLRSRLDTLLVRFPDRARTRPK